MRMYMCIYVWLERHTRTKIIPVGLPDSGRPCYCRGRAMTDPDVAPTSLWYARSHITVAVITALTVATAMVALSSSTNALDRRATPVFDAAAPGPTRIKDIGHWKNDAGDTARTCDQHSLRGRDKTLSPGITYVYLAGVEGSGHHALMSVFDALLDGGVDNTTTATATANGSMPVSFVPRLESRPVNSAGWYLWKNDDAARHRQLLLAFIAALRVVRERPQTGRRILFGPFAESGEPLSYPFGQARNAVSRPVFADVSASCAMVGISVKMIVLHRDPIAATYSRIHQMTRELAGHALLQARIVLDNLQAVASEMGALQCDDKVTIRYERLLEDPTAYASAFGTFTGIPLDAAHKALSSVKGSSAHDYLSSLTPEEVSSLESYFGYDANGTLPGKAAAERGFWPLVDPALDITAWTKRRRRRLEATRTRISRAT